MVFEQEYKTKKKVIQSYIREYTGYKTNLENILTKTYPFTVGYSSSLCHRDTGVWSLTVVRAKEKQP